MAALVQLPRVSFTQNKPEIGGNTRVNPYLVITGFVYFLVACCEDMLLEDGRAINWL